MQCCLAPWAPKASTDPHCAPSLVVRQENALWNPKEGAAIRAVSVNCTTHTRIWPSRAWGCTHAPAVALGHDVVFTSMGSTTAESRASPCGKNCEHTLGANARHAHSTRPTSMRSRVFLDHLASLHIYFRDEKWLAFLKFFGTAASAVQNSLAHRSCHQAEETTGWSFPALWVCQSIALRMNTSTSHTHTTHASYTHQYKFGMRCRVGYARC